MSGVSEFQRKRREKEKRQKVEICFCLRILFSEYTEKADRVCIKGNVCKCKNKIVRGIGVKRRLRRKEIKWPRLVQISVMEVRNSLRGVF